MPLEQINNTSSIAAGHDEVYTHLATVEGLRITEAVTTSTGEAGAAPSAAPDGAGGSSVTMMADAPAGSEAAAEMRVRSGRQTGHCCWSASLERPATAPTRMHDPPTRAADDAERAEYGLDAIKP